MWLVTLDRHQNLILKILLQLFTWYNISIWHWYSVHATRLHQYCPCGQPYNEQKNNQVVSFSVPWKCSVFYWYLLVATVIPRIYYPSQCLQPGVHQCEDWLGLPHSDRHIWTGSHHLLDMFQFAHNVPVICVPDRCQLNSHPCPVKESLTAANCQFIS